MKKGLDEAAAKAIARTIRLMLTMEKDKEPEEKTPRELLDERIAQLNRDIKAAEGNRRLQKQLLLQLKTAMRKRQELSGGNANG